MVRFFRSTRAGRTGTARSGQAAIAAGLFAALAIFVLPAEAMAQPSEHRAGTFGTADDIAFARDLWFALEGDGLVGPNALPLEPFFGGAQPHGQFLEITNRTLTVRGRAGDLVVKRNYDGAGISAAAVNADRDRYLSSIDVMFRREAGYDEDNQNWFWAKYQPGGGMVETQIDGRSVALAGRIEKASPSTESRRCIFCHRSAGGGDYVFYPQIRLGRPAQERNEN